MSSKKSCKRERKEIDREKEEIRKWLEKIRNIYEKIYQQSDQIYRLTREMREQAKTAGNQLLDEHNISNFWRQLNPLTTIIIESYVRLVEISRRMTTEYGESDSSSDSSQASSMRSSMSVADFNVSCGASTSNASCQTPMDPKGAGDAKKPSRTNIDIFVPSACHLRAISSADGVCHLARNSTKGPLGPNYDTKSVPRDFDNNIVDDVPDMVESTQCMSTKLTENQSVVSSASSSNNGFSVSFSNVSVLSTYSSQQHTVIPAPCDVGSRVRVRVSDVRTPLDFWVKLLDQDNEWLEFEMSYHCNKLNAATLGKNLSIGFHCCVWDDAKDLCFRAEIKRICYQRWNDESTMIQSVEVRNLDVGTLNVVTPDTLYLLSEEFAAVPASAMHCKLIIPCNGVEWSSDANAKFYNWVHENEFQMTLVDFTSDGLAVVELEEGKTLRKFCSIF